MAIQMNDGHADKLQVDIAGLDCDLLAVTARARLMDDLQNDGVKIALPVGDCNVDLLAGVERGAPAGRSGWIPIKVLAVSADGLPNLLETASASGLLVALVWDMGPPLNVRTFAFTRVELIALKRLVLDDCVDTIQARARVGRGGGQARLEAAIENCSVVPGQWRMKLESLI